MSEENITKFYSKIVGSTFKAYSQKIIAKLQTGMILTLEREPDNKFDSNAIKVLYSGYQLGYIPKATAVDLSKVMDSGKIVNCLVSEVTGLDKKNVGCNIEISY